MILIFLSNNSGNNTKSLFKKAVTKFLKLFLQWIHLNLV